MTIPDSNTKREWRAKDKLSHEGDVVNEDLSLPCPARDSVFLMVFQLSSEPLLLFISLAFLKAQF